MKGLLRRAAAALTAACLMSLSAFSVAFAAEGVPFETEGTPVENADMANALKETAAQLLMFSEEELLIQKAVMENAEGDAMTAMVDAILEAKKEYGAIKDMDYAAAQAVEVEDGTITVSIPMTFEEGQVSYLMNVHPMTGETKIAFVSGTGADENTTLGEQMKEGGIYSAFGLGTVFAVLIVISLVIAAFKLIGNTQTGKKEEAAPAPAPAPAAAAPVPAPAPAAPAEDLMDDTELLLLITTAIAAYESVPANGLKVRSIRRAKDARWRRA